MFSNLGIASLKIVLQFFSVHQSRYGHPVLLKDEVLSAQVRAASQPTQAGAGLGDGQSMNHMHNLRTFQTPRKAGRAFRFAIAGRQRKVV
jgi:hypothetical protein